MDAIPEVTDVEMAFGGASKFLPPWDQIPEEFKRGNTKWNDLFSRWFFSGAKGLELAPKEGVDTKKALRVIRSCMCDWGPSHEHKEAGVAFMLSRWFEDYKLPSPAKEGG